MTLVQDLVAWSKETFLPFGPIGLFIVAFMESSFFPIPPDLLLIPLALINPELALFYALVATLGSISGAVLGYYIGKKGGRPILIKVAGSKKTKKVEGYFQRYGTWAIGIAGFSPIPYKVFTIAAGVFKHDIKKLMLASLISRSARFFLVAGIIMLYVEEILTFIDSYFALFTILVVVIIISVFVIYRRLKDKF